MHLRSKRYMRTFTHDSGDGTLNQYFVRSRVVKAMRKITDLKGKAIAEEPFDIPVIDKIPLDEQLHPTTETVDMYKLDNLQKLNIQPAPAPSSYLPLSLDQVSDLVGRANDLDLSQLESNNQPSSSEGVINFNSNES